MKTPPFIIHQDFSGNALLPIDFKTGFYDEKWLQELLRQKPDILPTAEIEPIFSPLVSIGSEVQTKVGAIDNLFISPRGYLVLVETKLWRNPQAKREVIAQAIDYESSLSKWNYNQLNELTKNYTKKYEQQECDLFECVERHCGPIEGGREFFEETVSKNLRLGRFLTLIVADKIRRSMMDMLDYYVNKYPYLATDVALIEFKCYYWETNKSWPLFVIPQIVKKTEIVERSIVQITVKQDGSHEIDAQQEKSEPSDKGRKRVTLSEESFWELLQGQRLNEYKKARNLIEHYKEADGITIDPAESAIVARFDVQNTGLQVSLFFITTKAELCVWSNTIQDQLVNKLGLSQKFVSEYVENMRDILHMNKKRIEFACPIDEVDIDNFIKTVDSFCHQLQHAELE